MIRPSAGSSIWLLRHELRFYFRGAAKGTRLAAIVIAAGLLVVAAGAGIPLALKFEMVRFAPVPLFVLAMDALTVLLFTFMLSQTLSMATQAFYERGDLDLLLSSPIPPSRVLMVRCLGIAVTATAFYVIIATPFLVPIAILGHWQTMAGYGVLAALGLSATAWGLLLAATLFSILGPRRTKTVGQILAALFGALIILLPQSVNLLPHHGRSAFAWLRGELKLGLFGPSSVLSWPARAALGDPMPLFAMLVLAALFYAGVVHAVGTRFAANAAASSGADVRPVRTEGPIRGFRGGVRGALIRKELRLIARDPMLLAQVLLRVLYLIPLAAIMLQHARFGSDIAIAASVGVVTFLASQIAGSLAWITISAEDAPDLLNCAPISRDVVRHAKLAAAYLPVVVLTSPVLVLIWFHPWAGFVAVLGIATGSLSNGLIHLWYEKPMPRKKFRRRVANSLPATLGSMFTDMGWSATAGFAAAGSLWALALAIVPVGFLALLSVGANQDV